MQVTGVSGDPTAGSWTTHHAKGSAPMAPGNLGGSRWQWAKRQDVQARGIRTPCVDPNASHQSYRDAWVRGCPWHSGQQPLSVLPSLSKCNDSFGPRAVRHEIMQLAVDPESEFTVNAAGGFCAACERGQGLQRRRLPSCPHSCRHTGPSRGAREAAVAPPQGGRGDP